MALVECTFFGNQANDGSGLYSCDAATLERTVLAFALGGQAVGGSGAMATCCDAYGNTGGDWTGGIEGQLGIRGNISADPLFCDPAAGNFRLQEGSPCAPGGECDLMGAWPVGCGGTPVEQTTWGGLKSLFR